MAFLFHIYINKSIPVIRLFYWYQNFLLHYLDIEVLSTFEKV